MKRRRTVLIISIMLLILAGCSNLISQHYNQPEQNSSTAIDQSKQEASKDITPNISSESGNQDEIADENAEQTKDSNTNANDKLAINNEDAQKKHDNNTASTNTEPERLMIVKLILIGILPVQRELTKHYTYITKELYLMNGGMIMLMIMKSLL